MEGIVENKLPTVKLPSGKTITLNQQQADALSKMIEWLEAGDDLFFTLSGYAGTGKSTISLELINHFYKSPRYKWKRCCVSAPTHKAKKVIARATKQDAYTIQKLLGLRPDTELETFDINNPQFDEKALKEISQYRLIIIDEASMLNESLFTLLLQEAKSFGTKLLFMGDEAQLPPVGEPISKIFTDIENRVQLTKVERQADSNPLMNIYDLIRSDIKSTRDLFEHKTSVNEKGEGVLFYSSQTEFEALVLPMFASEEYKKDPDHIKLITYMNASVKAWNTQIRNYIFNMPTEPILVGEILFAYNTVTIDRTELLIENSSDYKVEEIEEKTTDDEIDIYAVTLRSVDEQRKSYINIVRDTGIEKFLDIFNSLLSAAKKASGQERGWRWKAYFEFKNRHLLLNDIMKGGRLLVKKDIDYGYAITVHKSQGSTFQNVAISENNLDRNGSSEERNKLKYVAFSRPTTKAIIFSNKAK